MHDIRSGSPPRQQGDNFRFPDLTAASKVEPGRQHPVESVYNRARSERESPIAYLHLVRPLGIGYWRHLPQRKLRKIQKLPDGVSLASGVQNRARLGFVNGSVRSGRIKL